MLRRGVGKRAGQEGDLGQRVDAAGEDIDPGGLRRDEDRLARLGVRGDPVDGGPEVGGVGRRDGEAAAGPAHGDRLRARVFQRQADTGRGEEGEPQGTEDECPARARERDEVQAREQERRERRRVGGRLRTRRVQQEGAVDLHRQHSEHRSRQQLDLRHRRPGTAAAAPGDEVDGGEQRAGGDPAVGELEAVTHGLGPGERRGGDAEHTGGDRELSRAASQQPADDDQPCDSEGVEREPCAQLREAAGRERRVDAQHGAAALAKRVDRIEVVEDERAGARRDRERAVDGGRDAERGRADEQQVAPT